MSVIFRVLNHRYPLIWDSGCPVPDCVSENQCKFESMIKKKKRELEENEYLRAKGSLL